MEARSNIRSDRTSTEQRDLTKIIKQRRATSKFVEAELSDEDLEEILFYAGQAPSGYNLQPWRFLVVRDPENKARLQKAAFDQAKVSQASAVIVFLGMTQETPALAQSIFEEGSRRGLGRPENIEKNVQDAMEFVSATYGWRMWVHRHTMIAFGFAMLMAEWLGYDTAPMEGFDAAAVRREFDIPQEGEVIALLAVGRAKEPIKKYPGRLPLEKIAFCEKYGVAWK